MPLPMIVRRLGPGDLALLADAGTEVFDGPVVADAARRFLADPCHHLVAAIDDGRIAGFASAVVCLHPDKPPELFVMEVGVAERVRRQGVGRRLVEAILAVGREAGCALAWVATETGNLPAQALYRAAGGMPDAEEAAVFTFPLAPGGRG